MKSVLDQVEAGKVCSATRAGYGDRGRRRALRNRGAVPPAGSRAASGARSGAKARACCASRPSTGSAARTRSSAPTSTRRSAALPARDQDLAARTFHHLVTPSGTKIALRVADLATYADVEEGRLQPLVDELAGDVRILRPAGDGRYEIYHDVLAGPILGWTNRLGGAPEAPSRTASAGAVRVRSGRPRSRGRGVPRAVRGRPRGAGRCAIPGAGGEGGCRPRQRSSESLRLALSGVSSAPTAQAVSALRAALAEANVDAVLRGHRGPVTGAAFSPDATRVVTSATMARRRCGTRAAAADSACCAATKAGF